MLFESRDLYLMPLRFFVDKQGQMVYKRSEVFAQRLILKGGRLEISKLPFSTVLAKRPGSRFDGSASGVKGTDHETKLDSAHFLNI